MKICLLAFLYSAAVLAEMPSIPVWKGGSKDALDPASGIWKSAEVVTLALQRTPLLFPTDAPAAPEIAVVRVQLIRGAGATFARLEWADKSRDAAELPKAERAWQAEETVRQSEATNRFSDACAIMTPERAVADGVNPSLQMGDAAHPVRIYFWDATRGAAVMKAYGRETTRRTGGSLPAQSAWTRGTWAVVMRLPELPEGAPVAIAVWNGAQQDRDGRKYFTVWYRTR